MACFPLTKWITTEQICESRTSWLQSDIYNAASLGSSSHKVQTYPLSCRLYLWIQSQSSVLQWYDGNAACTSACNFLVSSVNNLAWYVATVHPRCASVPGIVNLYILKRHSAIFLFSFYISATLLPLWTYEHGQFWLQIPWTLDWFQISNLCERKLLLHKV